MKRKDLFDDLDCEVLESLVLSHRAASPLLRHDWLPCDVGEQQ